MPWPAQLLHPTTGPRRRPGQRAPGGGVLRLRRRPGAARADAALRRWIRAARPLGARAAEHRAAVAACRALGRQRTRQRSRRRTARPRRTTSASAADGPPGPPPRACSCSARAAAAIGGGP